MVSVAAALRQHAPAYLSHFGDRVPLGHRKVISAITRCRTGQLGSVMFHCNGCGADHWVGRSCGNRHCPNCQKSKTSDWLAKQTDRLLPVHYFLVTFTVPVELRSVLRGSQREGYRALFDSGSETIRDLASATKSLRDTQLGYFGVLHTWGRDPMVYHPHVHFVVPGGGVCSKTHTWKSTPENFLFHHATACRIYKAKLKDELSAASLDDQVDASVWQKKFVVDIQPVGDGHGVLKYLAPYVHRIAISDNRIVASDENSVTFSYTPSKSCSSKTRRVSGQEFVRGFAQHILPPRFQKIRYYGWMSPNSRIDIEEVRWMVYLFLGWVFTLKLLGSTTPKPKTTATCHHCGGELIALLVTDQDHRVIYSRGPPMREAG